MNLLHAPQHQQSRSQRIPLRFTSGRWCRTDIADVIDQRLGYMVERFGRLLVLALTFGAPGGTETVPAGEWTRFMNSFRRYLYRFPAHGTLTFHDVWALERGSARQHFHYHLVVFADGNKTRSAYCHWEKAQELWARQFVIPEGATVHLSNRPDGTFLNRNDQNYSEVLSNIRNHCLYLAKVQQKGEAPPCMREHGSTQLSPEDKLWRFEWDETSCLYWKNARSACQLDDGLASLAMLSSNG